MTTERGPSKRDARVRITSIELRLYVAAILAAVYTISWRTIGGHAPAEQASVAAVPTTSEPQRFVWIDRLAPEKRPIIVLPAGWQLASEPPSRSVNEIRSATQPTRVVRVPNRRVPRVRTRSS